MQNVYLPVNKGEVLGIPASERPNVGCNLSSVQVNGSDGHVTPSEVHHPLRGHSDSLGVREFTQVHRIPSLSWGGERNCRGVCVFELG